MFDKSCIVQMNLKFNISACTNTFFSLHLSQVNLYVKFRNSIVVPDIIPKPFRVSLEKPRFVVNLKYFKLLIIIWLSSTIISQIVTSSEYFLKEYSYLLSF